MARVQRSTTNIPPDHSLRGDPSDPFGVGIQLWYNLKCGFQPEVNIPRCDLTVRFRFNVLQADACM